MMKVFGRILKNREARNHQSTYYANPLSPGR